MSVTLTIRDETLSGQLFREWGLAVISETVTVREVIRSRVYQEVQDYNVGRILIFHAEQYWLVH